MQQSPSFFRASHGTSRQQTQQVAKLAQNLNEASHGDTLQKRLWIIFMGGSEELGIRQAVERMPRCVLWLDANEDGP